MPIIFIGFLIGGTIPWLFSSLTINAVTRAAAQIVEEVRRQFRIPGIIERTVKPDYQRAVDICTVSAQRELIPLALIAVISPILIGALLGVEALGGFLAGVILSGQLLAVFMAGAGGAWDNAKKTIEDGLYGGKGSDAHHAAVVGDTVGDPLKDTAGPALNPMIKGYKPRFTSCCPCNHCLSETRTYICWNVYHRYDLPWNNNWSNYILKERRI